MGEKGEGSGGGWGREVGGKGGGLGMWYPPVHPLLKGNLIKVTHITPQEIVMFL